jgi:transposase
MERQLTSAERNTLIASHKKERDRRVCDRIKATLLYDKGYTYSKIAEILLLDDETVRRHIEDYFSKYKLSPYNGGSQSYLSETQTVELKKHLDIKTYLYVKDICVYVEKMFNKSYSISGMRQWLQTNEFRYKKPHGVPAKADLQRQEEFIKQYEMLKNTIKDDEIIVFGDSVHPQHQTRLAYGWIRKGIRKAEKMTACQKRMNVIGAINLQTYQVDYQQVEWVNTKNLKGFATHLIAANSQARIIHWFMDNAGYHKSDEFLEFIKETNIQIHYLPPYSPNLNPIERLWKVMHEIVTYNKYYQKFSEFTENILGFFNNINQYKTIIQSRINDNFQKLTLA